MTQDEQKFNRQVIAAKYILERDRKEWGQKVTKYLNGYNVDILFKSRNCMVCEMLKVDPEKGFVYDPETLKEGVERVLRILAFNSGTATSQGIKEAQYSNFADAKTRMDYMYPFVFNLDLLPVLGRVIIDDCKELARTTSDPEELEKLRRILRYCEREINKNSSDSGKKQNTHYEESDWEM